MISQNPCDYLASIVTLHRETNPNSIRTLDVLKKRPLNAVQITPRQHKRRRGQSLAYHTRVQKKWNKRSAFDKKFQVASNPIVLMLDPKFAYNGISL